MKILVSTDIIKDQRASVVDLELVQVVDGNLVKIMSWYDNEWGYASQMVREAETFQNRENNPTVFKSKRASRPFPLPDQIPCYNRHNREYRQNPEENHQRSGETACGSLPL